MNELAKFLSNFPFFENKKKLILYLEDFLVREYLIKPFLVFSTKDKFPSIDLLQCRTIINKVDKLSKHNLDFFNESLIKTNDLKNQSCLTVKVENCFCYYLNFGVHHSQFHFAIFCSAVLIPSDLLVHLSQFMTRHLNIIEKFDELYKNQELIHVDDVTGLYNQRKLYKDLSGLVEKFEKEKEPFCVLFIDIDHFKKVNDNYGHLVGSKLLEDVAKDVKSFLRDSDMSYRYGGDEFVVILANSNGFSGKLVGERILSKICSQNYFIDKNDIRKCIKLSVSIGVAEFPIDAKTAQDVLGLADRMMYEAKESGRGLVFNTQDIFKANTSKGSEHKS